MLLYASGFIEGEPDSLQVVSLCELCPQVAGGQSPPYYSSRSTGEEWLRHQE